MKLWECGRCPFCPSEIKSEFKSGGGWKVGVGWGIVGRWEPWSSLGERVALSLPLSLHGSSEWEPLFRGPRFKRYLWALDGDQWNPDGSVCSQWMGGSGLHEPFTHGPQHNRGPTPTITWEQLPNVYSHPHSVPSFFSCVPMAKLGIWQQAFPCRSKLTLHVG